MPKKIRDKYIKQRKDIEKDMKQKIGLFDKIPDHCLTCNLPFDKSDIEQVKTWRVVVRNEEGVVRLYCPECFDTAEKIVKDFKEKKEKEMSEQEVEE